MRPETALSKRFQRARDIERGMAMQLGRVIAVNNAQRRVDVALEGDRIVRNVPVVSMSAGTHRGSPFIGPVDNPDGTEETGSGPYADMLPSRTNDTWAIVGYVGGSILRPYVLGFLFDEQFETSFKDVDVHKFHNGFVTVMTDDAFEMRRPDGTYLRIGLGTAKADLGDNFDSEKVPFDDTAGSAKGAPDVILKHSSGTYVRITPAGSIIISTAGGTFALESHIHTTSGVNSGGPH